MCTYTSKMQELRHFNSSTHMDTFLDSLFQHTRTELIKIKRLTGLDSYFPVIPYLTSTIKKGIHTHSEWHAHDKTEEHKRRHLATG